MTTPLDAIVREASMLDRFTSTGTKFWAHREQMENYRSGNGRTVISTHISPEGACNLKCPYCSVTHRDTHSRINPQVIDRYVRTLKDRGLKAVILTGGGEPTAYPQFNELVDWLVLYGLKVALITNGTLAHKVAPSTWNAFEWVRVSVNFFAPDWDERISIPVDKLKPDCTVGLSTVFTGRHEDKEELKKGWLPLYARISKLADKLGAKYVRVLPDCLQPQDPLKASHSALDEVLAVIQDVRFFHQPKLHGNPGEHVCHQSFFRPYLSEEPNPWDGKPGTVFPCDSVVLNAPTRGSDGYGKFMAKYAVCRPGEIGDYLDGKIEAKFTPKADCDGCVFTGNVKMLGKWKRDGAGTFVSPMPMSEFV